MPLVVLVISFVDLVSLAVVVDSTAYFLVFLDRADVDVSRCGVEDPALLAVELVLVPAALFETAIELDQLAVAVLCHLPLLAVVDVAVGVEDHADIGGAALDELALIDEHVWHHERLAVSMELVILEDALVDPAVAHDHRASDSLVVVPLPIEDATIAPDHLAFALSLSLLELALVVGLLEFDASLQGRQRVLIIHLAIAVRSTILEDSNKGIAVLE